MVVPIFSCEMCLGLKRLIGGIVFRVFLSGIMEFTGSGGCLGFLGLIGFVGFTGLIGFRA